MSLPVQVGLPIIAIRPYPERPEMKNEAGIRSVSAGKPVAQCLGHRFRFGMDVQLFVDVPHME